MAGNESLRLFCALRLPDDTIDLLVAWQDAQLAAKRLPGRPLRERAGSGQRVVAPANLHVTLAFLGSRPAGEVPAIAAVLETAAGGGAEIRLRVRGYRETRSVGMLTFDDERGQAAELASCVHESLESLGVYRREARPWLPHVTVLRFRERPHLEPPLPALGEVCPSDAAVYSSVLQSGGAHYEALEVVRILDPFR